MSPAELLEWRTSRGLSTNDLAKELGVSQPTVTRWENGTRPPTMPLVRLALERLAQKLK